MKCAMIQDEGTNDTKMVRDLAILSIRVIKFWGLRGTGAVVDQLKGHE